MMSNSKEEGWGVGWSRARAWDTAGAFCGTLARLT